MTTIYPLLGIPTPGITPQETRTLTVNATRDGVQTPEQKEAVIFSSFYDLTPVLYFPLKDGARSSQTVVASALEGKLGLRLFDFTEEPLSVFKEVNITSDLELILDLSEDGSGGILDYPLLTGIGKLSGYFDLDTLPEDITYSDITIRAYYIDPLGGRFNGLQAAQVNCHPSGQWLIEGISGHHVYNVVISIPGYNDIIYSNKVTSDYQYAPLDPHWDKVVSLMHFDGNLTDARGNQFTEQGNALLYSMSPDPVFNKEVVFGTGWLETVSSDNFYLGLGDFTIEGFITMQAFDKPFGALISSGESSFSQVNQTISVPGNGQPGARTVRLLSRLYLSANPIVATTTLMETGIRYHFMVTRESGVFYAFLDGILEGIRMLDVEVDFSNQGTLIGRNKWDGGNGMLDGKVDEFRVTKGVARYTENFTPPTEPFPNY